MGAVWLISLRMVSASPIHLHANYKVSLRIQNKGNTPPLLVEFQTCKAIEKSVPWFLRKLGMRPAVEIHYVTHPLVHGLLCYKCQCKAQVSSLFWLLDLVTVSHLHRGLWSVRLLLNKQSFFMLNSELAWGFLFSIHLYLVSHMDLNFTPTEWTSVKGPNGP